jgi:hypothetical protein
MKKQMVPFDKIQTNCKFFTIIVFLEIIHCPVFLFETNNVLVTGLRLQVKPTQLGPIDRASVADWTKHHLQEL